MLRRALQAILLSLTTLAGCSSNVSSGGSGRGPACDADTLVDADNCGACGHSCLGGACVAGSCQPVQLAAFGPGQGIGYIALDEGFAYLGLGFALEGLTDGASCADKPMVVRVSRTTHEILELAPCSVIEGGGQGVGVMALAGSDIVWGYYNDPAIPNLQRVSTSGGPIVDLGDAGGPLVADATSVFYGSAKLHNHLAELAVGGGEPQLLSKLVPALLAIDSANLYFMHTGCENPEGCTVEYSLFALNRAGGTPQRLASKLEPSLPLVARGGYLYFGLSPGQSTNIARIPTAGGAIETVVQLPGTGEDEAALAVDDTDVYWTSILLDSGRAIGGTLSRTPIGGGATAKLVTGAEAAGALAIDDKAIVWGTRDVHTGAGTLWLLAK